MNMNVAREKVSRFEVTICRQYHGTWWPDVKNGAHDEIQARTPVTEVR